MYFLTLFLVLKIKSGKESEEKSLKSFFCFFMQMLSCLFLHDRYNKKLINSCVEERCRYREAKFYVEQSLVLGNGEGEQHLKGYQQYATLQGNT